MENYWALSPQQMGHWARRSRDAAGEGTRKHQDARLGDHRRKAGKMKTGRPFQKMGLIENAAPSLRVGLAGPAVERQQKKKKI